MEKKIITVFLLLSVIELSAQEEKIHQEKIKVFDAWIGEWQGSGWIQNGPGEPMKFLINEVIESKLDATILSIEGVGKSGDGKAGNESVIHHALAILSYDRVSNQYKFKSHLKNGRSTDAWFTVSGENRFQWGFETPQGKVRYSISLDPTEKTWSEIGEFGAPDNTWRKFMEMNLKRIK